MMLAAGLFAHPPNQLMTLGSGPMILAHSAMLLPERYDPLILQHLAGFFGGPLCFALLWALTDRLMLRGSCKISQEELIRLRPDLARVLGSYLWPTRLIAILPLLLVSCN